MNRRGFLSVLVAFAPVAVTPALAHGRSAPLDWALLQEDVIENPQSFGWLYRALVSVNGRALACMQALADDPRKSVRLMEIVRADARIATTRYYKDNK